MEKLIQDNYDSIKARGLITPGTTDDDFIMKLEEEVQEFIDAVKFDLPNKAEEAADVVMVIYNYCKHNGIDIEIETEKKIEINWQRAKEGK